MKTSIATILVLLLVTACGGTEPGQHASTTSTTGSDGGAMLLAADLPDAIGVVAAKAEDPDAEVAVYGRVRRTAKGVFLLVDDEAVKFCGQEEDCGCPTPWDYCCERPEEVTAATLVVEAEDELGSPVRESDMGIRALDLVAVRGRLTKADDGTLVLKASSGWFRRERPETPDNVKFN